MPAVRKMTSTQRLEIRRRRAAGQSLVAIGRLFRLPHQTVSRIDREERALLAEREAEAAAERKAEQRLHARSAGWTVTFDPLAGRPLYPSADCRIDYWAGRQATFEDRLNFNDVSLFQKLLPAEVRAMANGRQLFPYPPGTDRPDRTPPPQAA